MDVIFECPKCKQELSVDSTGAGTQIECPSCGSAIVIPEPPAAAPRDLSHPINPMATSAAAKIERHFSVPVHDKPADSLIAKPLPTLEIAAKESDKLPRVKTIKRHECVEVGKDHFDEIITSFLQKIGHENLISITTFNYSHQELETRHWITDVGVMIVFKG